MKIPKIKNWIDWTYDEYLAYFNSMKAVRRRTQKGDRAFIELIESLGEEEKRSFFRPVKERIEKTCSAKQPQVSIIMPAYNEQIEILPTILSYTLLDTRNIPIEILVVDNNSSDSTAMIIENCGIKRIICEKKGVAHARAAGYEASNPSSKYIWITDSDTRVIPPIKGLSTTCFSSSILQTAFDFMEENEKMLGVSTGALLECAHWSYELIHFLAVSLKRTPRLSCWSGRNQFIRRDAIEGMGGMDVSVNYDEDHHRHYQLARLGKKIKGQLDSANRNPQLVNPVYSSGRRHASLSLVLAHFRDHFQREPLPRDEYGYPIHKKDVKWRDVRSSDT